MRLGIKQIAATRIVESLLTNIDDHEHREILLELAEYGVLYTWSDEAILEFLGINTESEILP